MTEVPEQIGPYRIRERLGAGGMGEVYRAWDEDLERWVAIKLILAEKLESASGQERFRREARAAAGLSHPAIVRIYHILPWEDRDCIVMELVEGRSLASLVRDGPLDLARAIPLFREITEGLAEAHAQGIVHRDLKTQNVMVTSVGHAAPGRAKILDFGLAKHLLRTETSLSVEGQLLGTLHCMSPEQASGLEVDHRSDLFSLGVLFYEVCTGQVPFVGGNASETLARVCMHRQTPARLLSPDIPEKLSDLIDRLLEKAPDRRPQSADEVLSALGELVGEVTRDLAPRGFSTAGGATDAPARKGPPHPPAIDRPLKTRPLTRGPLRDLKVTFILTAILLIVVASVSLVFKYREAPRPSVAVLGFKNIPGEAEASWYSTAIAAILTTELAIGNEIRTIGGAEVARAMRELEVSDTDKLSTGLRQRLRQNLGADHIVLGSYSIVGSEDDPLLRVDLRLQDLETGEMLRSEGRAVRELLLFDFVVEAGRSFRRRLDAGDMSPAQESRIRAFLPPDIETARLYSEGLAKLRRLDALGARDLLQEAVASGPEHPLPYAALATAWSELGYDHKAQEIVQKAVELSAGLPEKERLAIEARSFEIGNDWERAIEIYGALFQDFPDDLDYGLRLADAQISGGYRSQALATIEQLRGLPKRLSEDPRIDLAQSEVLYRLGNLNEARFLAEKAAKKGQTRGAGLLVARARIKETAVLQALGDHAGAMIALEEARSLLEDGRDQREFAEVLELTAFAVLNKGELEGARKLFEMALPIYREIGDKKREASVLGTIGSVLMDQGELKKAEEYLQEALLSLYELDNKSEADSVLMDISIQLFMQGELAAASEKYHEALELLVELDEKNSVAIALANIAEVLYTNGKLDEAKTWFGDALAINRSIGAEDAVAFDVLQLGKISAAKGDLFVARSNYQEALDAWSGLDNDAAVAETRLELAILELIEGNAVEAEKLARQAEEVLRTYGWTDRAALAQTIIARSFLSTGRFSEAREATDRARSLAESCEDQRTRLATDIVVARMRATSGVPEDVVTALTDLDTVLSDAAEAGFVEYEFEARLAAGEVAAASGNVTIADARLDALAKDAEERGFGQIARRAAAARSMKAAHSRN